MKFGGAHKVKLNFNVKLGGNMSKKRFYQKIPHTFIILFAIILLASALTYILPAGTYERVPVEGTTRLVIDPNTYKRVDNTPVGIFEIFSSIAKGLTNSSSIIFMILISSGAFKIINSTGAINNCIGVLLNKVTKMKINTSIVIVFITFMFSLLGIIVGPEIQIPFTIIAVCVALGLGYDLVVGLAMIVVGGGIGFAMGPINASTVGTSQGISGLPLFSGMELRTLCWFFTTLISALVIVHYGKKVKKDPKKSYVYGIDTEGLGLEKKLSEYKLSKLDMKILILLIVMFIGLIVGPMKYGWYLDEMTGMFLIIAIVAAFLSKKTSNEAIALFTQGAGEMFGVAMMVGLGRAIQIILENGNVLDTVINTLSTQLTMFGPYVAAILMTLVHGLLNFLIPSGSGQAAATMPLMLPLGEVVGLTNQTSILAFQIGDGITNIIYPTLGSLMAMCGIARVPIDKWFKFAIKVVVAVYLVSWAFLFIAVKINWGPF